MSNGTEQEKVKQDVADYKFKRKTSESVHANFGFEL